MPAFVRVTEQNGRVQWVNLDHVRQLLEKPPGKGPETARTTILIDNSWVERRIDVVETAEAILAQAPRPGG